jgi:hypothetical protein
MASLHKDSQISVLFNDTAKRSDCLIWNKCLMSDELKGEELFSLATNKKFPGSMPDGVIGNYR